MREFRLCGIEVHERERAAPRAQMNSEISSRGLPSLKFSELLLLKGLLDTPAFLPCAHTTDHMEHSRLAVSGINAMQPKSLWVQGFQSKMQRAPSCFACWRVHANMVADYCKLFFKPASPNIRYGDALSSGVAGRAGRGL